MRGCVLCDEERLPEAEYAALFHRWGAMGNRNLRQRGGALARESAQLLEQDLSEREMWAHFAHHHRRQPAPQYMRRERALEACRRLSERQRAVILMVGRLGVASANQVVAGLYEGRLANRNAARAACYRELRPLIFGGFLYRTHLPGREGLAERPDPAIDGVTLLFVGQNGAALVEETDGRRPRVMRDARLVDAEAARTTIQATEVWSDLARGLREDPPELANKARLRIDGENLFGREACHLRFANPVRGGLREQISPSGLGAVSMLVPDRAVDLLLPFFFIRDPGAGDPSRLAEQLRPYAGLRISGALNERFPDLRRTPTVLLVCPTARRLEAVHERLSAIEAGLSSSEHAVILGCDRSTMRSVPWGRVWSWVGRRGAAQERTGLLKALAMQAGQEVLRSDTRLRLAGPNEITA